jgi:hypothetical protein
LTPKNQGVRASPARGILDELLGVGAFITDIGRLPEGCTIEKYVWRYIFASRLLDLSCIDYTLVIMAVNCVLCNRPFGSDEAVQKHLRDLPAYAPSLDCETCDRSFCSEEALEQHPNDSRIYQHAPETPLDVFFLSFRTFEYDTSLPPATSYACLREHEVWRRGDAASDNAWKIGHGHNILQSPELGAVQERYKE